MSENSSKTILVDDTNGDDTSGNGTETPYKTITKAVLAASSDTSSKYIIKLLTDINAAGEEVASTASDDTASTPSNSKIIMISMALTLDLNGKTLTTTDTSRIEVKAGGDLTITDSSSSIGNINHTVAGDEKFPIMVSGESGNVAKLTLDKCKITVIGSEGTGSEGGAEGYGVYAAKYSKVTSGEGVTITAGYSAISGNGQNPGVDVTITGGTYESKNYAAIYFPCTGKLTITGGEFIGLSGIEIRAGDAYISNAKISVTGNSETPLPKNDANKFRSDVPTPWGMGIAILDHNSYAVTKNEANKTSYNDINVVIDNVTFNDDANFDIYVGKHLLDQNTTTTTGTFVQNDAKTLHDINVTVNGVDFKGKGLYLYGANDVTITNCNFTDITASVDTSIDVNAIYLKDCRGNLLISSNEIKISSNEIKTETENVSNCRRGIYIYNCDSPNISIIYNKITNVEFNAIQIQIPNYTQLTLEPNLYISNNKISEWDADNDGVSSGNTNNPYAGGRAVRIDIHNSYRATIFNNTFSKSYDSGVNFVSDLGSSTSNGGYDNGNVLKLTAQGGNNNTYAVTLELNGNKLNNESLSYTNNDYVILPSNDKATFSTDPQNLFKKGNDSVSVKDLIEPYNLYSTDGGYTFYPGGTLKYVTGYDGFSSGNLAMQSGYYLPFRISFDKTYDNLEHLSVTLKGDASKTVGQKALDSGKTSTDDAYMDVVFFIGSLSSIEITIDTDTTDANPAITYIIYLIDLDLEQSVKTAPLVDHGADGTDNIPITPKDYKVEMKVGYNNIFILNVTAHDLKQHYNAQNTLGYWVGVAIPVPEKITTLTGAKYSFNEHPLQWKSFPDDAELVNIDGKYYVCFYFNADTDDAERYVVVDWDGDGAAKPLCYAVNLDVTFTSDEFVQAPLIDHATEPGKEVDGVTDYSVKVGVTDIKTLYLTAKNVPSHINGAGTSGYWVGIGFKAPTGADFSTAKIITGWGDYVLDNLQWNDSIAASFDSHFGGNDTCDYFSTYYNFDSSSNTDNKAYIMIKWNDNDIDKYLIDFSGVSKKSSSTGGGGTPVNPPVTPDTPKEPIIPDSNGNVDVVIDDKKADELVHEAVSSGSDTITILDTKNVSGNVSSVTVSTTDLETISKKIENNNNIDSVSIETSNGDIIIEKEVLSSILENTKAESVSFEVEDAKNKLTEEQKKAVGDRPVYDISIKAGNENVTSFNGKAITISLPYTLKAGEDPKNIVVYYVKEDGSLDKINCEYKNGKVIFDTDHLSKYVIGYEEQDKPVTPDTPEDKKESSNNTIYYAVAAVIIILIIIALAYYFMKKKQ